MLLEGAITNEAEFLARAVEIYPEIRFYSGTVEGSPDGTQIAGSEQERKRTELSFLCLFWLLRGDYQKLTQLQPAAARLKPETFEDLKKTVSTLLHDEEAIDAMLSTMAIHDLGKIVWFQNKVKTLSQASTVDHDEILLLALQHASHLLPSYSRQSKRYRDLILNAWGMKFNMGQFVQGENLPANLVACTKAAESDSHVIDYFFLHEILDLGGVTGHVRLDGSQTLNEQNIFAYKAAWDAVVNPSNTNALTAYDAFSIVFSNILCQMVKQRILFLML